MIIIKNHEEIAIMRKAGRIVGETLLLLEKEVKPGITTANLDRMAEEFITKHGAKPSFKGLYGFPSSLCISVNEQVIHGFPGSYVLKEGDIVSIDCGASFDGYHGDAARTFPVGNISVEAHKLIDITKESFFQGIKFAKTGNKLTDISHEIQSYVEAAGFSVVRDFVGHGIGRRVHEDPNVPNFGKSGRGPKLVEGLVLAIEPMVNIGTHKVKTLKDGWTVVTADFSLSAHYENTVAILSDGPEILTLIK
ncbi:MULTISPECIES: type I methionyl aminopeptidase [Clostridium]|jgi:methionyl aminopeptidase|uniref:Methionine aminopeptidase n=1 Tax=Clostridium saccharoperbutylacetonicum N1-4(HMT) TaxID=931276 RepID=M1MC57_9CLOT|nr:MULTISPECIES: type I methionyl aminopeptidase [Clostridium]AGF54028.1 methionine aminopeptidase Map [Clostridium saccharoperbutylacetonicum N1-4(HMT)]AQR92932.1 methionine aminopeptidase 1 [Clostridium saccharoperbutylacetonicum]NRT59459.1 methionyl aminopeptidase [Clostridium saccharoperbutylacetonicum]NSB28651.1 methionyl aminopeptidase [Clostridium saccharoperbutylacetonicum]NSB34343.1 methionyl aminopeptidase [Clostridium saccharoperbutylacetonicum]